MKVLTDFHHPDLYESFCLAMEDRLGWEVYRMIGMEWMHEEIWQHEVFWAGDKFGRLFLPVPEDTTDHGSYLSAPDHRHSSANRVFKMLTLETARDVVRGDEWVVMPTVPGNQIGFHRFAMEQGAKYAVQIGNNEHPVLWELNPMALDSTEHYIPKNIQGIKYDQEIDTRLFHESPVPVEGPVASFVAVWHNAQGTYDLFNYAKDRIPEREFIVYGDKGTFIDGTAEVAARMAQTAAFWHSKEIGDGWGHVIHASAAIGRPLIGHASYYRGLRGEWLWDPRTSLDLTGKRFESATNEVRGLLQDSGRLERMGALAQERWRNRISYERDAWAIRQLLEQGPVAR